MRSLGWALIPYDQCPYKKRRLGHRKFRLKEDHVRTQQEDSHLQAKERGLRRNQTCQHFDLGLQPPGLRGSKFLLFKPPSLWYFVMAAWANNYTWLEKIP